MFSQHDLPNGIDNRVLSESITPAIICESQPTVIPEIKLSKVDFVAQILKRNMQEVVHNSYQDLGNIGCNEYLLFYDLTISFSDAGRQICFLDAAVNFGKDALKLHDTDRGLFKDGLQVAGGLVRIGCVIGSIADTAKAAAVVSQESAGG